MWPGWGELALLAACGVIAGIGAYALAQGYRAAPARVVAPFEYVMILWAVLWGYVFWGDVPKGATLIGVTMTVGAGLWVMHHQAGIERERRRHAHRP
jgi:drug/metabolite transporter (DMT)-like permease